MKKHIILLLIILLCIPSIVYAEGSEEDDGGGIFGSIEKLFQPLFDFLDKVKEIFQNIAELTKLVATEIIPAFVKLIKSIFDYFTRLFEFMTSFINVPATPIPSRVMAGVNYVTNFTVGGVGILSLVISMLILFLSLKIVKKFVL